MSRISNATLLERYQAMAATNPGLTVAQAADRLHMSVAGLRELVDSLSYRDQPRVDPAEVRQMLVWAGNAMYERGEAWWPAAARVSARATARAEVGAR